MQIPRTERQVVPITPQVPAGQLAAPPQEAFGAQTFQSIARLGQHLGQFGEMMLRRQMQINATKEEADLNERARQYIEGAQKYMHSEELDDDGQPKGAMYRTGMSAGGITQGFGAVDVELQDKITQGLSERSAKKLLAKIAPQKQQFTNTLSIHEAGEQKKMLKENFEAATKRNIDLAAAGGNIEEIIADQDNISIAQANVDGQGKEYYGVYMQEYADKVAAAGIGYNLEKGDIAGARENLKKAERDISNTSLEKLNGAIDDKENFVIAEQLTQAAGKDSLGMTNMMRLNALLQSEAGANFTDERKQKIYDIAQARAGEQNQRERQRRDDNDQRFKATFIEQFKKGMTLENALKLTETTKFGLDKWDKYEKEEWIRKFYKEDDDGEGGRRGGGGGNDVEYLQMLAELKEKVIAGAIHDEEIIEARGRGLISLSDAKQLMSKVIDDKWGLHNATGAQGKIISNRAEMLAKTVYSGKSKESIESRTVLLTVLRNKVSGMTYQEATQWLNDLKDNRGQLKELVKSGQGGVGLSVKKKGLFGW